MIPKYLKDKIIALGGEWKFNDWQNLVFAHFLHYRMLARHIPILIKSIEEDASPELIKQRAQRVKDILTVGNKEITSSNK